MLRKHTPACTDSYIFLHHQICFESLPNQQNIGYGGGENGCHGVGDEEH